jgi:hypothetical protein
LASVADDVARLLGNMLKSLRDYIVATRCLTLKYFHPDHDGIDYLVLESFVTYS